MNYALIDNGQVSNIIWLSPDNLSDFPNAVQLNDLPVGIGDTYEDGVFLRGGKRLMSAYEAICEELGELRKDMQTLNDQLLSVSAVKVLLPDTVKSILGGYAEKFADSAVSEAAAKDADEAEAADAAAAAADAAARRSE